MELYMDIKKCRVISLVDSVAELENQQRVEYKKLIKEAEKCKQKAEEYNKWKNNVSIIQRRFYSGRKLLSLLELLGASEQIIKQMDTKLLDVTLEQMIPDGNIEKCIKDISSSSTDSKYISVHGEYILMKFVALEKILDVQKYANALYEMYLMYDVMRKSGRDLNMYDDCLKNLRKKVLLDMIIKLYGSKKIFVK